MAATDRPENPSRRADHPAMVANRWQPGQPGGGHLEGAKTVNRWRRAINAAVTDEACVEVIEAMQRGACGVLVQKTNAKTGETSVYEQPPDPACARVFLEVLKVIGPGAKDDGELDPEKLKTMPDAMVQWIADNGLGN